MFLNVQLMTFCKSAKFKKCIRVYKLFNLPDRQKVINSKFKNVIYYTYNSEKLGHPKVCQNNEIIGFPLILTQFRAWLMKENIPCSVHGWSRKQCSVPCLAALTTNSQFRAWVIQCIYSQFRAWLVENHCSIPLKLDPFPQLPTVGWGDK